MRLPGCLLLLLLLLLTLGLPAGLEAKPPVEIIAHRGESADAPENTLAALELAWQRNVPAIELDVHLTKDDVLVLCHDADTERTTGVKKVIAECTFEELQTLDAGSWKEERFRGEKMPRLEEALATIPEGARCFIEVKVGPEAVPALVRAVRGSNKKPEQLAIISFQADTIAEAKRQLPELQAYYLSSFKQNKRTGVWSPTAAELIETARSLGADALDLSHKGPIDADFVAEIKAAGFPLYVWTIDDLETARRLVALGVAGITTNKAAWLQEALAQEK